MQKMKIKKQPNIMVVNKKAVDNIGADTVRSFSRYNVITRNAIGKKIFELAGKVGHLTSGDVFSFDPDHTCGSVPIRLPWIRNKGIIIIFKRGVIIIIDIVDFIPRPKPNPINPIDSLKDLNNVDFTNSTKNGDMRTIDMKKDGKLIGDIKIIANKTL